MAKRRVYVRDSKGRFAKTGSVRKAKKTYSYGPTAKSSTSLARKKAIYTQNRNLGLSHAQAAKKSGLTKTQASSLAKSKAQVRRKHRGKYAAGSKLTMFVRSGGGINLR